MSNQLVRPQFDKVTIERQKLTTSGIIIPDSAAMRNAPCKGVVTAIGPDVNDSDATDSVINVGDTVIFGQNAGSWINPDQDDEFFICLDTDILAIVEEG